MHEADYAYAVARIRANELSLLTKQELEMLVSSGDCDGCLARLADKGWGDAASAGQDEASMLAAEERKAWALIDEIAPDRHVFDSLKLPNDFHNLKATIKSVISGVNVSSMLTSPVITDPAVIERAVREKDFSLLPEYMRDCAEKAYTALLETADGQLCDIIIDRACLESTLRAASAQGGIFERLAQLDMLEANLKIACRCVMMKKPYSFLERALAHGTVPDAKALATAASQGMDELIECVGEHNQEAAEQLSKGLSRFESWCTSKRTELITPAKHKPLGVDPLVAYLIARKTEVLNVRIIMSGLRNDVDPDRIRSMLRDMRA